MFITSAKSHANYCQNIRASNLVVFDTNDIMSC